MTLLDVWIIDDDRVRRTILDDNRKCVTACKFANQMLKIRVRSWAISSGLGSVNYSIQDVFLPVPFGMECDAVEITKLFNENIAREKTSAKLTLPILTLTKFAEISIKKSDNLLESSHFLLL